MSVASRPLAPRQALFRPRPAPHGTRRPSPTTAPPDGWRMKRGTRRERAIGVADRSVILLADSMARRISRRRFIRGLGSAGLVVGVAGARALWGSENAWAVNRAPCNVCVNGGLDRNGGACGPSEECASLDCSGGNCAIGHNCGSGATSGARAWSGATCRTSPQGGTWQECCSNIIWICRDCCGCQANSSGTCSAGNCGGALDRHKCICEKNTGNSCTPDPSIQPC